MQEVGAREEYCLSEVYRESSGYPLNVSNVVKPLHIHSVVFSS